MNLIVQEQDLGKRAKGGGGAIGIYKPFPPTTLSLKP